MSPTEAPAEFFINVPQHNYLELYDSDERRHAGRVANFLRFEPSDLSQFAGLPKRQVRSVKDLPRDLLNRLIEIGNICELVAGHFHGDQHKTYLWFTLPNMMLGNIAPRDMIRIGRYRKLYKFVIDALSGYGA